MPPVGRRDELRPRRIGWSTRQQGRHVWSQPPPGSAAMILEAKNQFHTAMVVEDIDRSMQELTGLFGLHWSSRIDTEVPIWSHDGGVQPMRFEAVYSVESPHLELIAAVPGTMWGDGSRPIHHFGYWADDLVVESAELEKHGLSRVAGAMVDGVLFAFAYHATRDGLLVELVDRSVFPDWEGFLNGDIAFGQSAD